jgi:hypothetical protein
VERRTCGDELDEAPVEVPESWLLSGEQPEGVLKLGRKSLALLKCSDFGCWWGECWWGEIESARKELTSRVFADQGKTTHMTAGREA